MFEKLKQLKELKDIRDSLSEERVEVEKQGIKVSLNGNLEIQEIILNQEMDKENQERVLRECLNEGVKKVQFAMAQKFKGLM